MIRALRWLGLAVLVLGLGLTARALLLPSKQLTLPAIAPVALEVDALVERFAAALRFETISNENPADFDAEPFHRFAEYLAQSFPQTHATLGLEKVNQHSLLYRWQGRDAALAPVVLLSHHDVVPIAPGTLERWTHPPFSGAIADGEIWGRGALDDKFGVLAILEAVEHLLGKGFTPQRTIYLAFGHDEELGGDHGAKLIAELLAARGVRAEYVLDEGGAVIEGVVPGVDRPVAMIGIAEKGSVTVKLTADAEGGHSSTPPESTAVGVIARAVHRLEQNQMPEHLQGATRALFDYVAPEMAFPMRLAMANLWLFEPVLRAVLAGQPATNATLRTTTAATIISGGVKANVLPATAQAVVNFRILPGDTIADVVEHVRRVVDDPQVRIDVDPDGREATSESPVDVPAFAHLQQTITEIFDGAVVSPFLTLGGTDSRHYQVLTANIYRFTPIVGRRETLAMMHGTNERVGIDTYVRAVRFFLRLLERS